MHRPSGFSLPPNHRSMRRPAAWVLVVLALLLAVGCTDVTGTDDEPTSSTNSLLPMTITEWLFPPDASTATGEPIGVAHISIAPMTPGDNGVTVELTNLDGKPLPAVTDASAVTLRYRAITPDASPAETELERAPDVPATWRADALSLPDQGWYAFEVALREGNTDVGTSAMYALLPDPSVYGAGAVDLPESDPAAEALYQRALDAYGSWDSGKWRESLGSGTDVVVVTRFAVTNRTPEPPAMRSHSVYAGAFREKPDGSMPAPPRRDFATRITIGQEAWTSTAPDQWVETGTTGVATFKERADIYTGAINILPGGTATINGVETEIITFYLPEKSGQSEAWFVWWIDPDTGNPVRMMMVAEMHFMIWDFYEVNGDFTIDPPTADAVATPIASD